jgi:hypothetical protein
VGGDRLARERTALDWRLTWRRALVSAAEERRRVHVEFERMSTAVALACTSSVKRVAVLVTTAVLVSAPSPMARGATTRGLAVTRWLRLAVSAPCVLDDLGVLLLVVFVELAEDTSSTGTHSLLPRALLLHTDYRECDIECLLEGGEAGGAAIAATPTEVVRKYRRVQRRGHRRRRRRRGRGGSTPWVREELVDGVSLPRVDAEQVRDKILSCNDYGLVTFYSEYQNSYRKR